MISLKSLCAVVLAVPCLAKVIMHEQFEPKSFKWYDSKEAARFDYDSGNNPVDPIKEYGLYAKIGDRTYVKSAPLNPPVSVGEQSFRIGYSLKQDDVQECGDTTLRLIGSDHYSPGSLTEDSSYLLSLTARFCKGNKKVFLSFRKHSDSKLYSLYVSFADPSLNSREWNHFDLHWGPTEFWFVFNGVNIARQPIDSSFRDYGEVEWIEDQTAVKPEGWVDNPYIVPDDVRRLLEVTAELIPDPDEERPPDAPDDWSPTLISNPDWDKLQSQVLRNPEYHGRWSPPRIKNPNYLNEPLTGVFEEPIGAVAVIVKTKTPGILVDNIDFEIIDSE